MGNVVLEILTRFCKPYRVKMRFDQIPIRQFQSWRTDDTAYHLLGLGEIMLVMRALGGAVCHDQVPLGPSVQRDPSAGHSWRVSAEHCEGRRH